MIGDAASGSDYRFRAYPNVQNINGRRHYHYGFWKDSWLPIDLDFDLVASVSCVDDRLIGSVTVENIEVSGGYWLNFFGGLADWIANSYRPNFNPMRVDGQLMDNCNVAVHLCFRAEGLVPQLGACAN